MKIFIDTDKMVLKILDETEKEPESEFYIDSVFDCETATLDIKYCPAYYYNISNKVID